MMTENERRGSQKNRWTRWYMWFAYGGVLGMVAAVVAVLGANFSANRRRRPSGAQPGR